MTNKIDYTPDHGEWVWYENRLGRHYRIRTDDWLMTNRLADGHSRGYQVQTQDWVRDHFRDRPAGLALDIGANMGITAIEYNDIFDRVVAYEPVPELFNQLTQVLERNDSDRVEARQLAVADRVTETQMRYRAKDSFSSRIDGDSGDIPVSVVTIDSEDHRDVAFIKIDVEGAEAQVLWGAEQTIVRDRPVIQFEYKPKFARRYGTDMERDCCQWLESRGYRIQDKRGRTRESSKNCDLFAIPL
jgi:FkbM family methyltransferase